MNRNHLLLLLISLTISTSVDAQRWKLRRYEAIVGVGTTTVYGDIGGTADESNLFGLKDIRITDVRPSFRLGIRYKLEEDMSLKMNFIYGRGYSTDDESRNDDRNLGFRTGIFETSIQYEYYLLKEDRRLKSAAVFNRRGMINNYAKTALYVFAGAGGIAFKPQFLEEPSEAWSLWNSTMEDRHEVLQETAFSGVLLGGLGLKYTLDSKYSLGFELGYRYSFTDLLDGISAYNPPFNNEHNDVYYFSSISLIYKVRTDRRGRPVIFR